MPPYLVAPTRIALWLMVGLLPWSGLVASTSLVRADEPAAWGQDFFEKRVRPLLAEHCWDCHGEDHSESELRLDSLNGFLRGGKRGPALVAKQADASLFISAVRHGEILKMPPKTNDNNTRGFKRDITEGRRPPVRPDGGCLSKKRGRIGDE
mgnify:CR=1 FL=1